MNLKRTVRLRLTGNRTRYRNWLSSRAWQRGKTPLPDRIARRFSNLPVYRNRINRATGRPHRYDKQIGALRDRTLARFKARNDAQAARAEHNQRFVRETLTRRDPQYAQTVERAARELSGRQRIPSRGGRSRL